MAQSEQLICITRPAGGDLSTKQYLFVELGTGGTVTATNADTDIPLGILQNDPDAANRAATVGVLGVSKVVLGATIAAGVKVGPGSDGRAVATVSAKHVAGILITGGDANEIGEVLLGITPPILV